MSCNPAVGESPKDRSYERSTRLGGYMGIVTDQTAIQFRMLNRSKGPAMWSPRAPSDRARFIDCWRGILENMPNLSIWQDMVQELIIEYGQVWRRSYGNECRIPCRSGGAYERDLPKRSFPSEEPRYGRIVVAGALATGLYRATYLFRYPNRSHENRNTGPY